MAEFLYLLGPIPAARMKSWEVRVCHGMARAALAMAIVKNSQGME